MVLSKYLSSNNLKLFSHISVILNWDELHNSSPVEAMVGLNFLLVITFLTLQVEKRPDG